MSFLAQKLARTQGVSKLRLGFWNRLAIVLIAAGALITATRTWYVLASERVEVREEGYSACIAAVTGAEGGVTRTYCRETWISDFWLPGWEFWLGNVGLYLLIGAAVYLVIWIAVAVIRWVWRGRVSSTE